MSQTQNDFAKKLAVKYNMQKAEDYKLCYREFDNKVEVIGYMQDPTFNYAEYGWSEPIECKGWFTIGVLNPTKEIRKWLN